MARSTVFLCASIVLVSLIRCSRQSTTGAISPSPSTAPGGAQTSTVSATPSASPSPTAAAPRSNSTTASQSGIVPTTSGILSSPSPLPTETPAETKFQARISVDESYKSSYDNKVSIEYVNFTTDFETKMKTFFSSRLTEIKRIEVTGLKNGSVVVAFDIVVGVSSNASKSNIRTVLTEGNRTGDLRYTIIGEIYVKRVQESSTTVVPTPTSETVSVSSTTSAPVTTATPTSSTKGTEIWDKAIDLATPLGTFIIVIVAVALVLILLIALIYICCKYRTLKKRTRFPDHMTINDSEWIRSNDDLLMWERNLRASEVKTNNGVSNRPFNEKRA